jgi:hypothetical protein
MCGNDGQCCDFVVVQKALRVSLSTMEAEFIAASLAGRELLGTKELLKRAKAARARTYADVDRQSSRYQAA